MDPGFLSVIDRYSSVRVLCVGDVMLDRFVHGNVSRISPEAPIPVFSVRQERSMLGGAGNVARNIAALGAKQDFLTVVGRDLAAEEIGRDLAALDHCTPAMIQEPRRKTSIKIRYLAQQQQVLRVDSESTEPLADDIFSSLLERFLGALSRCDVVVLSDYAKGVLSGERAGALINAARSAAKPVFVDPKGLDFGRYRGAALIKPNLHELREATRMAVDNARDAENAARAVLDSSGVDAVLVTRGAEGMMLVRPGLPVFSVKGGAREVFDVSGAGDTAAANLAVAFAAGAELEDSVRLANIAAGIAVSKLGTATVTREQLLSEMRSSDPLSAAGKITDYASAAEQAARWRGAGMRVHAIAGRFDMARSELFHLLRAERSRCDKLVIGFFTGPVKDDPAPEDAEIRDLLSALMWVDLVVPCPENHAAQFVAGLRGDV
jgi:D-beta-D-heptose 7-phosphate kinase / D-beta-D-heptose 1-phosphate adenosyltransferase